MLAKGFQWTFRVCLLGMVGLLAACGGGSDSADPDPGNGSGGSATLFSIGGNVSGLNGTLVLQNNGGDDLSLSADGSFTFGSTLASGSSYSVSVQTQPAGQSCTVSSGSGTVSGNVTNIAVSCTTNTVPSYSISGTVLGLNGTLVLQNNGGDDLSLSADGSFSFPTAITDGGSYNVTVKTQPASQSCSVSSGSGTASGNVTNVAVSCTTNTFSVGGTVSGLNGTLVLQNNGGDDLSLSADGSFSFPTAITDGGSYNVTVKAQPASQSCSVSSGSGTASSNVTNIAVSCTTNTVPSYSIGGTVSGLNGTLVLQNNGGDDLSLSADGSFSFPTAITNGGSFSVTVKTQPTNQSCAVSNAAGTVSGANVTSVAVSCTTNAFSVGGTVSGLSGTLVLQNSGADDLTLTADGSFSFATAVDVGGSYSVTVKTQPSGQSCTVANGSGTVGSANVSSVTVHCLSAPVASLSYGLKAFNFSWAAVSGATYYQLYENADGASGFSLIADNISTTSYGIKDVVLYNRINAQYVVTACNADGCADSSALTVSSTLVEAAGHFRESSPAANDYFGISVALAGDGKTMVVGAYATNSYTGSATVFAQGSDGTWSEQAQLLPVTSSTGYGFGTALSADGNVMVIGGYARAHIYNRSGTTWTLVTTLHPTGITSTDYFGWNLGLSADGTHLAVTAAGAKTVYVFGESGGAWSEQAQLVGDTSDYDYGVSVSMADDGSTLAVGSRSEGLGFVYLYDNNGGTWTSQAKVQATGLDSNGSFGSGVALNGDGTTLAVGASDQNNNAGKAFVFTKSGSSWTQVAELAASNGESDDHFGAKLDLTKDGTTLAVTATYEAGNATGINGADNNDLPGATNNDTGGAAYIFKQASDGSWSQKAYVKGTNPAYYQRTISLAYDGTLAVGALLDQSDATGISFGPGNDASSAYGAAYLY